jgi:hypothetical protein
MMTRSSLLLALLLAAPAGAARRAEVPPASDLLALALHPTASYRAQGRVQFFPPGRKAKSQALSVSASGERFYKEFSSSAKKPAALALGSDGRTRSLLHVRSGALWTGPAMGDAAASGKLLAELYELSSSSGGVVARRSTWRLDFREKKGGALRRSWWLDRKSGALLRREQYRADGSLSRRERFSRFQEGDPGRSFAAPSGKAQPWTQPGGLGWRPDGFLPLEQRRGDGVRVYVYGDGQASLTLTRSAMTAGARRVMGLVTQPEGLGWGWLCGEEHCYVEGDLLEDELRRAAASVEARP